MADERAQTSRAIEVRPRIGVRGMLAPILIVMGVGALTFGAVTVLGQVWTTRPVAAEEPYTVRSVSGADDHATVLDPCSLSRRQAQIVEAPLTEQQRITVTAPVDAEMMTVQAARIMAMSQTGSAGITDPADCRSGLLAASIDQVTVDRKTLRPRPDQVSREFTGPATGGSAPQASLIADRSGLQYRFPPGVQASGRYTIFDLGTRTVTPLHPAGAAHIEDLSVLVFTRETSGPTMATPSPGPTHPSQGSLTRPRAWFPGLGGAPTSPVTARVFVDDRERILVDPRSGIIIDRTISLNHTLRVDDSGGRNEPYVLPYVRATLSYDSRTRGDRVAAARRYAGSDRLSRIGIPAAVVGIGILATGLGVFRLWRIRPMPADPPGADTLR